MMMYGLVKIANEQEKNNLKDAALAVGGAGALSASHDRLLGRKKLYHGTSKENAESIKREGFKLSDGTSGIAVFSPNEDYVKQALGHSYFTPRRSIANRYASAVSDDELIVVGKKLKEAVNGNADYEQVLGALKAYEDQLKKHPRNLFFSPKTMGGEVMELNLPYIDYRQMEIDPEKSEFPESIARHIAVRTQEPPDKRYIMGSDEALGYGSRLKESLQLMPDYIKAHPGRFGSGAGLAGAGLAGLGLAAHNQFNRD